MLVCCYTNHALDQFLEDLVKQGVPRATLYAQVPSLRRALKAWRSQLTPLGIGLAKTIGRRSTP